MKSKVLNWMLMAAVVCGLGMSVISCSDDDDNGKSEEQKQQEAQQKASKFWDVVGQLVSDDETEDYANMTFEPTIGVADANDPQTRIVNTNDMKTAAMRFANLVGTTKVNENTASYSYSDPDVGTLTYTKGDGATAWATVDVNIKQIPHLSKIIYRQAGEGENGKFNGKAYYRFGDVIKRQVSVTYNKDKNNDNRGTFDEYWICVRPAFGPEGKEDSHWVCVNTVTDKNYKYYHGSNDKDYWLPTNLKENKEQMQNFAEMLYAICFPEDWHFNADNYHTDGTLWGYDGVPIFHDFTHKNLKYHNQYFWMNVQDAWKNLRISENAMLLPSFSALSALVNSKDGIHLLYKGYSWWFTSSWDCELWEAIYTNGTTNEEKNMHADKYNDGIEQNMKDVKFDCRAMGNYTSNYMQFFNNDAKFRWTIRHATGKDLASATNNKYDAQQQIKGYEEVYRYYAQYPEEANRKDLEDGDGPEVTPIRIDYSKITFQNRGFYDVGDVVQDAQGTKWFCVQPSGHGFTDDLSGDLSDYAYFVSYRNTAVGKNLVNITTNKDLAMQMMFCMESLFHNAIGGGVKYEKMVNNIKQEGKHTLSEIIGIRDSVVERPVSGRETERNSFISTIYRKNNELYVLRLVGDYTLSSQDGRREYGWKFWTGYTKDPAREMLLADLGDTLIIRQYNEDPWVRCIWWDYETKSTVARDNPLKFDQNVKELANFVYYQGICQAWSGCPKNMYREPLYAFAVKRVKDEGRLVKVFEDGTNFEIVRMMKEIDNLYGNDDTSNALTSLYRAYKSSLDKYIMLNGEKYAFGLKNRP